MAPQAELYAAVRLGLGGSFHYQQNSIDWLFLSLRDIGNLTEYWWLGFGFSCSSSSSCSQSPPAPTLLHHTPSQSILLKSDRSHGTLGSLSLCGKNKSWLPFFFFVIALMRLNDELQSFRVRRFAHGRRVRSLDLHREFAFTHFKFSICWIRQLCFLDVLSSCCCFAIRRNRSWRDLPWPITCPVRASSARCGPAPACSSPRPRLFLCSSLLHFVTIFIRHYMCSSFN